MSFSEREFSPKGLKLTEPEVLCVLNYRHFRAGAVLDNVSARSRGREGEEGTPCQWAVPWALERQAAVRSWRARRGEALSW